ncbi:MAG: bifunctional demethylmenaquinone methyltransferase/2-methoxy-6-polyprenyl-1,4-benzoquinol methylase UbiE [Prevotella sp.]|nr:bifunctional demethylmenaquinone methyltransferase/2-methoxy-6-polyprenyl-1,4-benzoquinol methylase UbiE [Prevotella sp.]MDY4039486.1 bifunctional demethylmenaquinone methyltransferase/2-methoxy-6-polyprenyl-1,4-benzoquinol methylase UbiE [Prevotella sp.]
MYRQEEIKPYGEDGDKGKLVEQMFNHIAPTYDTLNHRLSWNIDKSWRRKAISQLMPLRPKTILDIATGTGDFAILAARMIRPKSILGIDISEGMMEIGRQKVKQLHLDDTITFQKDDCLALSIDDNTFDAATAAFGIRNFADLDRGLKEIHRVLKPGGQLSIVELSAPQKFPMRQLFKLYSHTILPIYGKIVSKDINAYQYLTSTMEAFPQGEMMKGIFEKAGYKDVKYKRLTFGICTMYLATK